MGRDDTRRDGQVHLDVPDGHNATNLSLPIFTSRRAFQFEFNAEIRMKIQLFVQAFSVFSMRFQISTLSERENLFLKKRHFCETI